VIKISRAGTTRSPVIVIGPFAFKFARNKKGRACNLYEAKLYRNVNATRRALLYPVLWVSRNGAVQIMRAAVPLVDMMSMEEYWRSMTSGKPCRARIALPSNRRRATGVGSRADELPWTTRFPPGRRMEIDEVSGFAKAPVGSARITPISPGTAPTPALVAEPIHPLQRRKLTPIKSGAFAILCRCREILQTACQQACQPAPTIVHFG
jgi:hypothetical protein